MDPKQVDALIPAALITAGYPMYGELFVIVFASLAGALVALSVRPAYPSDRRSRWYDVPTFIFRHVCVASFSCGALAAWLSKLTGVELYWWLALVAFFAAVWADAIILRLRDKLIDTIINRVRK